MTQSTNDWLADVATLALWNRDRQNQQLQAKLVAALHTYKHGGLLFSLAILGTNVTAFVPEIRRLVDDPDPSVSHFAKRALQKIQPMAP